MLIFCTRQHLERANKNFRLFSIIFFGIALIHMTGCQSSPAKMQTSSHLDNIVFKSMRAPSGVVRLVNGVYIEKSPTGNSAVVVHLGEHMARGKIDQNDVAVAILVSDVGAGEIYYDLVLLKKTASGWEYMDGVELGDRVKVQALSIAEGEIVVDLKIHGPYDRDCCATLETVYRYQVAGGRMKKKPDPDAMSSEPELTGTVWKWQETYFKDDTYVQSYDRNAYTIQLLKEGGLSVRADCNMAGGEYTLDGEYIHFQITRSTRAACAPDSLADRFLEDLGSVARYYFKNQKLYIVLKGDGGVMVFSF